MDGLQIQPQPLVLGLQALDLPGVSVNVLVPRGDLLLEDGHDGRGLPEELVLEELRLQEGLAPAEVLDEAEELRDVWRAGLDLGGGAWEVDAEGAREHGAFLRGFAARGRGREWAGWVRLRGGMRWLFGRICW